MRLLSVLLLSAVTWFAIASAEVSIADWGRVSFSSPTLVYSTTFGRGTGTGREIAIAGNGEIVIAGNTESQFQFPLINAADEDFGGSREGFIARFNAAGDEIIFSTYLGGDGDTDYITGLALDSSGNAYVSGVTNSLDFPVLNAAQASPGLASNNTVRDGFAAKLSPTGALLWSTYLGGSAADEAFDVAVDADGNAIVVGRTDSEDFPTASAFQPNCALAGTLETCEDGFITKFSTVGAIVASTYIGGTEPGVGERTCSVDTDGSGNIYVVGNNRSDDFPTVNPAQPARGGGTNDLFVAKLPADMSQLTWSTHLGGSSDESSCSSIGNGPRIAVGSDGSAFVGVFATSTDMPLAGESFQPANAGQTDGYVAKYGSDGDFEWATYLGGPRNDFISNITVTAAGVPVVVGQTSSTGFPVTDDALEESDCPLDEDDFCQSDAFISALGNGDGSLIYSTFLGDDDGEEANGVVEDSDGSLVITGETGSSFNFPLVNPLPSNQQGSGSLQIFVSRIGDAAVPGDASGDGIVTASDALIALSAALGASECLLCICDMNGDGSLTATDALIVLNLAVGLDVQIENPPC